MRGETWQQQDGGDAFRIMAGLRRNAAVGGRTAAVCSSGMRMNCVRRDMIIIITIINNDNR